MEGLDLFQLKNDGRFGCWNDFVGDAGGCERELDMWLLGSERVEEFGSPLAPNRAAFDGGRIWGKSASETTLLLLLWDGRGGIRECGS